MLLVTLEQMKYLEKKADESGVSYAQLMENAGAKLAGKIEDYIKSAKKDVKNIVFLCGSGNNAGDCFVASRYLSRLGYEIMTGLLCGQPKTEISKNAFDNMNTDEDNENSVKVKVTEDLAEIKEAMKSSEIIVDGVFGTGFHGELPEDIRSIFEFAGTLKDKMKISVDIASGGNGNTGKCAEGTFKADLTVTFGAEKTGMEQYPLKDYCGKIRVAEIGIPEELFDMPLKAEKAEMALFRNMFPKKKSNAHKGNFGRVFNIVGSVTMPGAGILAVSSGLRSGVGISVTATAERNLCAYATRMPETMLLPMKTDENGFMLCLQNYAMMIEQAKRATSVLIGCGIGVTEHTKKMVRKLIKELTCPIVIDADGINCIADCIDIIHEKKGSPVVLTPHPAEFSRITGRKVSEIQSDRIESVLKFTEEYPEAIVVLKGAGTVTAQNSRIIINTSGNPAMSRGGSGDVLAGLIAGMLAYSEDCFLSTACGVYIHGLAGDIAVRKTGEYSMLPSDTVNSIPEIIKFIEEKSRG